MLCLDFRKLLGIMESLSTTGEESSLVHLENEPWMLILPCRIEYASKQDVTGSILDCFKKLGIIEWNNKLLKVKSDCQYAIAAYINFVDISFPDVLLFSTCSDLIELNGAFFILYF